jgi:hypothetical protein
MWSMISDRGRQVWKYIEKYGSDSRNGSSSEEAIKSGSSADIKPSITSRNPVITYISSPFPL